MLFFINIFLHFYLVVDPRIIYTFNGVADYAYLLELRWEFFRDTVFVPGGAVNCLMGVITHACHERLFGALLITLAGWALYAVSDSLIKKDRGTPWFPLLCFPAFLILLFYGSYYHNYLYTMLVVLGALLFVMLYRSSDRLGRAARTVIAVALFFAACCAVKHGALLFAFLICQYECFRDRKYAAVLAVTLSITAGLLDYCGTHLLNGSAVFDFHQIAKAESHLWLFYFYFPAVFLVSRFGGTFLRKAAGFPGRHPVHQAVFALLLLLGAAGAALSSVNADRKDLGLRLHYLRSEQWDKVLGMSKAAIIGSYYPIKIHAVNFALAKTGRLGSAMFEFPQTANPDALLLIGSSLEDSPLNAMVWAVVPELFLHLGALNYAEKFAGEAMGNAGALPFLMRVRALVSCAKGQKETAAVYLNRLATVPFYRSEARALLDILYDDARLAAEPEVRHLRECRDTTDRIMYTVPDDATLAGLLASNSRNRLAFDYLMAYYLQTKQLKNFYENLSHFTGFSRNDLPVHYADALTIFTMMERQSNILQEIRYPDRESGLRMATFDASYERCRNSLNPAREMYPLFGSSYFFFFVFGFSGAAR